MNQMDLESKRKLRTTLHVVHSESGKALREFSEYWDDPPATDEEIDSWPLYAGEQEWGGGIWCAVEDCPLQAENSEIGDFRERDSFTLAELRQAIGAHILAKVEREEEEPDDDPV